MHQLGLVIFASIFAGVIHPTGNCRISFDSTQNLRILIAHLGVKRARNGKDP